MQGGLGQQGGQGGGSPTLASAAGAAPVRVLAAPSSAASRLRHKLPAPAGAACPGSSTSARSARMRAWQYTARSTSNPRATRPAAPSSRAGRCAKIGHNARISCREAGAKQPCSLSAGRPLLPARLPGTQGMRDSPGPFRSGGRAHPLPQRQDTRLGIGTAAKAGALLFADRHDFCSSRSAPAQSAHLRPDSKCPSRSSPRHRQDPAASAAESCG